MKFFFDNNLPPQLAHGVAALSKNDLRIESVIHLSDRFDRAAKDLVWLSALEAEGGPWYVISIDKFKKDHRAEREAIRRCGHTIYVLDPQWSVQAFWAKAAKLILWWPVIVQHASLTSGGVHRVPWRHTSQSRFQSM